MRIADGTQVVREELASRPRRGRPRSFAAIAGRSSYVVGGDTVAFAVIDGAAGAVDEAWRDFQVETPLARGYEGAVAQTVNAP